MSLAIFGALDFQTRIVKLIENAINEIVLVSPYTMLIGDADHVGRAVHSALANRRRVSLYIRGDDGTAPNEVAKKHEATGKRLAALQQDGLRVYEVAGLHAKLYIADARAIVSSMNLLQSSMTNIEFGIEFSERSEVEATWEFFNKEIQPHAKPVHFGDADTAAPGPAHAKQRAGRTEQGHCIRCGTGIAANPDRPLCSVDFKVWRDHGNVDYRERYCHLCGKPADTSLRKPLCRPCFSAAF